MKKYLHTAILALTLLLTGCNPPSVVIPTNEVVLPKNTHVLTKPLIIVKDSTGEHLVEEGLNWVDSDDYSVSFYTPTVGAKVYYRFDDHSPFMSFGNEIYGSREMNIEAITKKGEEYSDTVTTTLCSTPKLVTSHKSGVFNIPFKFSIECDADVYYTTNGKPPTTESPKYTEPIDIQDTTSLKILVCKAGHRDCNYMYYFYKDDLASNTLSKTVLMGDPIAPRVEVEDGSCLSTSRATYAYDGGSTYFTVYPDKNKDVHTYMKINKEIEITELQRVDITEPCTVTFYTKKDGSKISEHSVEFKAVSSLGIDGYKCLHKEPFTQRFKSLPKEIKVFYTLNESTPTVNSLSYDTAKGIQINDTCVLKVLIVEEGKEGKYLTYPFIINDTLRE